MLLKLIYQTLLNICASSMKEGFDTISLLNILFFLMMLNIKNGVLKFYILCHQNSTIHTLYMCLGQ
jgi:hypothetical protein